MPDGKPFHTGNIIRFFYVDENGNDLINPKDLSSLPVSTREKVGHPPKVSKVQYNGYYNNNLNRITYNENKKLHEFFTFALGDSKQSKSVFNVYHKGSIDEMEIVFRYQSGKTEGGTRYLSTITSWKVNGNLIYTNSEHLLIKDIYLVKKTDGTTSIQFEKI